MNIGDLPAAIFSPVKVAYISWVILMGLKVLCPPSWGWFLGISVFFILLEIGHNDCGRILLNRWAESIKFGAPTPPNTVDKVSANVHLQIDKQG